jgi:hypothetical protein
MNESKIVKLCALILLWLLAVTAHADSPHSSRRTILISFDGAQPQVIEQLLRNKKLASDGGFATLIREGVSADGMTSVLPTVTATNISPSPQAPIPRERTFRQTRSMIQKHH